MPRRAFLQSTGRHTLGALPGSIQASLRHAGSALVTRILLFDPAAHANKHSHLLSMPLPHLVAGLNRLPGGVMLPPRMVAEHLPVAFPSGIAAKSPATIRTRDAITSGSRNSDAVYGSTHSIRKSSAKIEKILLFAGRNQRDLSMGHIIDERPQCRTRYGHESPMLTISEIQIRMVLKPLV